MEATMDERETRDGTRGEAVRSDASFGAPPPASGTPQGNQPGPEDAADLPPLPPPPPVGADMAPESTDEQVPDRAYEPPPTPVDGALWPGANPFDAAGQDEEDPEL